MRNFVLYLSMLGSLICFSQEEDEGMRKVPLQLKTAYNQLEYTAIHDLFDPVMKSFLSMEETADFFNEIRSNYGSLLKLEFSGRYQVAYAYSLTFEKGKSKMYLALDEKRKISSLFIPRNPSENVSLLERNITPMIFPFKKEAFVYWGGDNPELNYHMEDLNQQYAYDILMVANGAPYSGDPEKNESYFVYGQDLMAPCDAKVYRVIDGVEDNKPGVVNSQALTGNTIILETDQKEYLLFAHLKANSIQVKKGDIVKQGQVIAQCGNSGNTTQAHLHLQLQNTPDLYNTIGAKLYFKKVHVNGEIKEDYMPVKEDFVRNEGLFSN